MIENEDKYKEQDVFKNSTSTLDISYTYDTGIEKEKEIENSNDPFNPDDISIDSKVISMDNCLRRLIQGTINLNPDFQRKEVWTPEKKSQLIESLMLKIPIPMFYVSSDEKGNYTVVDGLQRLSTIRSFILGDDFLKYKDPNLRGEGFKLQKLEFWEEYKGLKFNDLPIHLQNRILETEFTFTIINPGTPEVVKRNIFKRINTGGMPLSRHEIRNALYVGYSTELLKKLASTQEFKEATGSSVSDKRMEDKELILRFVSFSIIHYSSYRKTIGIDTFLSNIMIVLNSYPSFEDKELFKIFSSGVIKKEDIITRNIENIEILFKLGMKRSYKIFGKHSFRRSILEQNRSPINRNLFEIWGTLLSQLSENEFENLLINKNMFIHDYDMILNDDVFIKDISTDSMKHTSVQRRFDWIEQLIKRFI